MWYKQATIILLFYFLALIQNSFLVHFSLFGIVPNFIFILFFALIFFSRKSYYSAVLWSFVAGLFLDVFSSNYIGVSIVLLILVSMLQKQSYLLLAERTDKYPFAYFAPLFLAWFIAYRVLFLVTGHFLNFNSGPGMLGWSVVGEAIYNLIFASLVFYIYKKIKTYVKWL